MLKDVLKTFGLNADLYTITQLGTGLINHTWKITDAKNEPKFILQQINKNVFASPQLIADNIDNVAGYLSKHYPNYLFVAPIAALNGDKLVKYDSKSYYRLFPYVKDSITITTVQNPDEGFEAAVQFAQFTGLLDGFDISALHYTLPGFHNLSWRFEQFSKAVNTANEERINSSRQWIEKAFLHRGIVETYNRIINDKLIPLRVIHHDTKISNILFNEQGKGICVIDLDTVMPGYYISDVGDMMRTYLSPANEEEKDLAKIEVRDDFFKAITEGYFKQMGSILTDTEKSLFVYSGKFMIYMQALRFLTDYLNNDIYYGAAYPEHNLIRTANQITLLEKYIAKENNFQQIVDTCISNNTTDRL